MAIIAVLVAIAVPLFVGEIDRARETTFEANKRAARGAVIAALLKDGDTTLDGTTYYTVQVNTETGAIGTITTTEAGKQVETMTYEDWQKTGANDPTAGTITVEIEQTDLEIKK